jgi:hypothetical protein
MGRTVGICGVDIIVVFVGKVGNTSLASIVFRRGNSPLLLLTPTDPTGWVRAAAQTICVLEQQPLHQAMLWHRCGSRLRVSVINPSTMERRRHEAASIISYTTAHSSSIVSGHARD